MKNERSAETLSVDGLSAYRPGEKVCVLTAFGLAAVPLATTALVIRSVLGKPFLFARHGLGIYITSNLVEDAI